MAKESDWQKVELDASMRVVALISEDAFLLDYHTRQLAEALIEKHGEIQRFVFDGSTTQPVAVLDELRSFSLMQQHKLVIVDDADEFLKAPGEDDEEDVEPVAVGKGKGSSTKRALMERYAGSPEENATLLLRSSGWKPGNLDKLINKVGAVIKIKPVDDRQAVPWAMKRCAKEHGKDVTRDAAERLVELIGPDLAALDSELQKLATYAAATGAKDVTAEHVSLLTGMSREDKAWAIQSAVLTGSPETAVTKLRELLEVSQVDEVPLTWSLMDLSRKIHAGAWLAAEGQNEWQIGKALKLWGEATQQVVDAARRVGPEQAAQLLQQAVRTDRENKFGIGEPRRNLESLTLEVADTIGRRGGRR